MIAVLGKAEDRGPVRLERSLELARPRGIPVLVDAASELIERPSPWLARGADLVVYSGGKFLRGPQTSGLLLGRKALVQAAWRNASPHQAFGRPMKVSKEDVIGVLAALEALVRRARPRGRAPALVRRPGRDRPRLAALRACARGRGSAMDASACPRWPSMGPRPLCARRRGAAPAAVGRRAAHHAGRQRRRRAHGVEIEPFNLQPGEAKQVGRAIAAALAAAHGTARAAAAAPAADLSGEWEIDVTFLKGARRHRVSLTQTGADLSGRQEVDRVRRPGEGPGDGLDGPFPLRDGTRGRHGVLHVRGRGGAGPHGRQRRPRLRHREEPRAAEPPPARHRELGGAAPGLRGGAQGEGLRPSTPQGDSSP